MFANHWLRFTVAHKNVTNRPKHEQTSGKNHNISELNVGTEG